MDGSKDELKWFGEGFNGFPINLPEDCVEYAIYIVDAKLLDSEVHEQLRQVQTAGIKLTNQLLTDFIWQREGIKFELKRDNGSVLQSIFTLEPMLICCI